jgi:hypothetical protein
MTSAAGPPVTPLAKEAVDALKRATSISRSYNLLKNGKTGWSYKPISVQKEQSIRSGSTGMRSSAS